MLFINLQKPSDILVVDEHVLSISPAGLSAGGVSKMAANILFQLMYAQLGRPDNLDPLYNTALLKNATNSVFEGIARDFARESLLVSEPFDKLAKGWVTENRLHTRHIALWIMVAGFCLLAIICLLLFLMSEQFSWIPSKSVSLAGSAAILTNSPSLQVILAGSGLLVSKELRERLAEIQFFVITGQTGNLKVQADSSFESRRQMPAVKNHRKWYNWVPLSVRLPVIAATFTAPLIAIGILELLYHVLRDESHLVQIEGDSSTLSYIIRISSTLVVFGIATMINNLDSIIVIFAPYSNIRPGSAPADRSILFHLLSVNPLLVMAKSLQRRYLGPAVSNAATLIAGFLTFIVSRLWIPVNSLVSKWTSTAAINNWDRTWLSDAAYDGGAAVALGLIRFGAAETPTGIWKDVVVPEVSFSADSETSDSARRGATYTYDVLALQPFLNCTVIPQNAISNTLRTYNRSDNAFKLPSIGTLITVQPPGIHRRCSNSSINGFANLTFGMEVFGEGGIRPTTAVWVGQYFDLPQSTAGQVSTACPSIGVIFGRVTGDRIADRNLIAAICSQMIRQVPVIVTYNGNPSLGKINSVQTRDGYTRVQNDTAKAYTLGYGLEGFKRKPFIFSYRQIDD